MKSTRLNFWIAALFASVFIFGCDGGSNDPDPISQSSNPLPATPGDANAVLAAIKVKANTPVAVPVPGIDILIDVASANFYSSTGGTGSLVSVGNVSLNDYNLTTVGGNSYINNPTDIMLSLNSGQTNKWNVAGANGFAAINHTTAKRMPGVVSFTNVGEEISKSGNVTLTIQAIPANIDNLLWVISDGSKIVTKEARATSVTFSSAELNELKSTSTGIVQVAAYNTEGKDFGGKKIYFINETVDSKFVKIN